MQSNNENFCTAAEHKVTGVCNHMACIGIVLGACMISGVRPSCADELSDAGNAAPTVDRFGGTLSIESEATGWFRVEQIHGRWLLITPEGHGYIALGANHVGKYLDQQAESMGLLSRFSNDRARAAKFLASEMRQLGLTAGEAYAPLAPELQTVLPWVANLKFPGPSKFAFDVFDEVFQTKLKNAVVKQCEEVRDNPMVIGLAFADLPVWDERRVKFFESLDPSTPGVRELAKFRSEGRSDDEFLARVADVLYAAMKTACEAGAPNHLFFGERHRLRGTPDLVLKAIGRHIDVFCTQALILSPQRPPEWQVFQADRYQSEHELTGKPMIVIDWAAPFSLSKTFATDRGELREEEVAANDAAEWLVDAIAEPYIVGVFKCQLIGLHANDRWFNGKARRTYLKDNGMHFDIRTEVTRDAHNRALQQAYRAATEN